MEPKFTPGPWEVSCNRILFSIHQKDGAKYTEHSSDVAMTEQCDPLGVQEANANLIAAAPEMYEALEEIITAAKAGADLKRWMDNEIDAMWGRADAALRKARGEE